MVENKDFEQIVEELRVKYKCNIEILTDSEKNLQGILYHVSIFSKKRR